MVPKFLMRDKAGGRLNGQEPAATGIVVSPHCRGRTRTNVTSVYGSGGEGRFWYNTGMKLSYR